MGGREGRTRLGAPLETLHPPFPCYRCAEKSVMSHFFDATLPALLADEPRYLEMIRAGAEAIPRYFTYEAVTRHIHAFFTDPTTSELKCAKKLL